MDIKRILIVVLCSMGFSATVADISKASEDGPNSYNTGHSKSGFPGTKQKPTQGNHPVNKRSKTAIDRVVVAELNGIKQKVRELLHQKKFDELNSLLHGFHLETESDISLEQHLFAAYDVFRSTNSGYEKLFSEWINTAPDSYQPYLARASHYYALGKNKIERKLADETRKEQFEDMRKYFQSAELDILTTLSINKNVMVPYCLQIAIKDADDDVEQVIQEALRIEPATYEVRTCYLNSITPRWGGSYKKMRQFVDESLAYAAINEKLYLLKGVIYAEAGRVQSLNRKYALADKLYTQALNYGIDHATLMRRGINRYKLKNYQLALDDFNNAIELFPVNGKYYYWRSLTYSKLKQYEKSVDDIEMAKQLDPWDKNVQDQITWLVQKLEYMGYGLNERGSFKEAIKKYSTAIRLDSNRASTYYRRSISYIARQKPMLAIKDIKSAIDLDPEEFTYYKQLDLLLAKMQDWDQIITYWDKFISLYPKEGRAYIERGDAYYRKGDIESAVLNVKVAADMGNLDGKKAFNKIRHLLK